MYPRPRAWAPLPGGGGSGGHVSPILVAASKGQRLLEVTCMFIVWERKGQTKPGLHFEIGSGSPVLQALSLYRCSLYVHTVMLLEVIRWEYR